MRKDYLIAGLVIIFGVVIYSKLQSNPKDESSYSDTKKVHVVDDINMPVMPIGTQVKMPEIKSTTTYPEPGTSFSNPKVQENFKNQLDKVLECVSPDKKGTLVGGVEPNFQNLVEFFNESFGQYVVSLEDWVQSDVRMDDGTLKRVRVDTTYIDQASPERRISVFGIDQTGSPQVENLDPEKSFNPTDEYINSFFKGAEPMLIEKSQRVYFPNGEELILIEKNGRIDSITVSVGAKTISCSGLDQESSTCDCN